MSSFEIMLYITAFNTIFVILCFLYVYLKEREYKKQIDLYMQLFENINQEIHFLKKSINENKKKQDTEPKFNEVKMQDSIKKQSISILNEVLPSIIDSIHQLNKTFNDFKTKTNNENQEMQKKVKEYTSLSTHSSPIDSRQIIQLHKSGKSSEEISGKLGIPKSEIDLAIKMDKS